MKIAKITKVGQKEVYDISVEEAEHYVLDNGVVTHNTGITYSSDAVWVLGRQQEKEGTEISGYNFIINIEKSRHVKEKSKIPVSVSFKGWIDKNSGLIDLALESGNIIKPKNGWYAIVNMETGEISEKSYRLKELESNKEFFANLIKDKHFKTFIENRFKLGSYQQSTDVQSEEVDYNSDYEDEE